MVRAAILSSSDATCSLDLIPTRLLKSCLDSFLLPITTLINLSISESIFPDEFKSAIVIPLHKKHSLPIEDLSSCSSACLYLYVYLYLYYIFHFISFFSYIIIFILFILIYFLFVSIT